LDPTLGLSHTTTYTSTTINNTTRELRLENLFHLYILTAHTERFWSLLTYVYHIRIDHGSSIVAL